MKKGALKTFSGIPKLYDFSIGQFVGCLVIPATEKCLSWESRRGQAPIKTDADMTKFTFHCRSSQHFIVTLYTTHRKYENSKLTYTLLHNKTILIPWANSNNMLFLGFNSVLTYLISANTGLPFVIYRNIHTGLTIKQRGTFPVTNKQFKYFIVYISELQFLLGYWDMSQPFLGFKIMCYSRNPLRLKTKENHLISPIPIEIDGWRRVEKEKIKLYVIIDQKLNFLHLSYYKNMQGVKIHTGVRVHTIRISQSAT
jgi:hypothetical protein